MRPTEFTSEAIILAGQALHAAGRNITGFALRQKVGGGNPARLKQVWDEHQSSQAATVAEPVAELPVDVAEAVASVSKSLTERIAALAVELNDRAVKAADRRTHEVVRSAGEQRAQAERELADAAETVDDLETKLDEAQEKAQWLETKLAESKATEQAQAVELAQLNERLTLTEQTAKAATEQHAAELARITAAHDADRARHLDESNQVRAELLAVKTDLGQIRAEAKAADQSHQEQRKAADQEAKRATERLAKAEAGQEKAHQEAAAAREDAAKLRGQVEAMQTQAASLMQALAAHQEAPAPEAARTVEKAKPTSKASKS